MNEVKMLTRDSDKAKALKININLKYLYSCNNLKALYKTKKSGFNVQSSLAFPPNTSPLNSKTEF